MGSAAAAGVTASGRSESLSELSFVLPYGVNKICFCYLWLAVGQSSWEILICDAWGVELGGGWESFSVTHGRTTRNYRWPSLLLCKSVGPGPAPRGLELRSRWTHT